MKIKKVEFKNFKCYPNLIIPPDDGGEFPNGLFLIQGTTPQKSNSFGKTSFVEGILFGFFGPQSISLSIDNSGNNGSCLRVVISEWPFNCFIHRGGFELLIEFLLK